MVIYESKGLKVEIDKGILTVEEGGRTLNIDLKIYVEPFPTGKPSGKVGVE